MCFREVPALARGPGGWVHAAVSRERSHRGAPPFCGLSLPPLSGRNAISTEQESARLSGSVSAISSSVAIWKKNAHSGRRGPSRIPVFSSPRRAPSCRQLPYQTSRVQVLPPFVPVDGDAVVFTVYIGDAVDRKPSLGPREQTQPPQME